MTLWTLAFQAHLSVGFSKQEYWSGLPFPSPKKNTGGGGGLVPKLLGNSSEYPMLRIIDL